MKRRVEGRGKERCVQRAVGGEFQVDVWVRFLREAGAIGRRFDA